MKLLEAKIRRSDRHVALTALVETATGSSETYFKYPERFADFVAGSADAFVPALLLPCLETGEDLEVVPPISARLLSQLHRVQELMRCRGTRASVP